MGALPSRESNEGPNTVYFGNNTGVVTFRIPLTPHYFPSADCLAFKEVYRVRDSQSCKYSFNIREASAVLPAALAKDFATAQEEYWGPEAETVDPSLHYHDEEIQTRLVENGFSRSDGKKHESDNKSNNNNNSGGSASGVQEHIRRSIESRHELYQKLVVEPTKNALVDTDDEMREIFLAEQRWRAARDTVRRHRNFVSQQRMTEQERSQVEDCNVVTSDVSAAELEAAESVPPPRMWLRPIPEAVIERMSMEATCAAHRAYRERHNGKPETLCPEETPHPSTPPSDRRHMHCNLGRGPARAAYPIGKSDEVALNVLDMQGRQPFVETETLNEEMLKSYPSFQDSQLPFELDEQYMDGRVHMVAYEGVNYLFAYNPDYCRAMGKTVVVDGSRIEERRRQSGAVQSEHARSPFTTTHTVATRKAEDFNDPNQRRAYEIFQPIYARYYIPVIPVRVLGVDGLIPCSSGSSAADEQGRDTRQGNSSSSGEVHGAPWMRGVDDDPIEEDYLERQLPQRYGVSPPPVLRACRFIHAVIGDKILNRMSVLGCMTFRERCVNAGLPDAIACPLWNVMELSDIPQLQFQREIELRLLAAMREIDDGDMRIRRALARQHQWNNYVDFTNSPMYGFMVSAPPERRFRVDADGKLRAVDDADADEAESCCSSNCSGNEETSSSSRQRQQKGTSRNTATASATSSLSTATSPSQTKAKQRAITSKENEENNEAVSSATTSNTPNKSGNGCARPPLAPSLNGATNSPVSSDAESRDEHSGSTSTRSAAHNTSAVVLVADNGSSSGEKVRGGNENNATLTSPKAKVAIARVKRTRDGYACTCGCAPAAETHHGANDNDGSSKEDDDLQCLAEPPAELNCAWSFKRRRLGIAEEVTVNPNFSEEDWMPMVNPLTKDTALASMGIRLTVRGRLALVRYSASAVQKVCYYLSQASAPIFCLPYVGPPQQCPNVYLEDVVRAPTGLATQSGVPPPTKAQVETSLAAYAAGRVSCYVFANMDDRAANPPTSCIGNHYRDDVLMSEAVKAGVTSKLVLAQLPIKADARCALGWYHKSLAYGALSCYTADSPYAAWPSLLDAPAPCDGDVLVVCPRTHRWIRVTTLMLLAGLLVAHKKIRENAAELVQSVPVLDLFNGVSTATEVDVCYNALVQKNMDSEGMQCHMLNIRRFFSYNGIVELMLDRLRTILSLERYENKDDEDWLVLHEPPSPAARSDAASSTTTYVPYGPPNSGAAALTTQKYLESGSYFIWSFLLLRQRFFYGTRPRFIRLALQRQKQNQRRRQKRKERDAAGAGAAAADNNTRVSRTNRASTTSMAVAASTKHVVQGPTSGVTATAATQPGSTGIIVNESNPSHIGSNNGVSSSSGSHNGRVAPQTTLSPAPAPPARQPPSEDISIVPSSSSGGSSNMPMTAAGRVPLAQDVVHMPCRTHARYVPLYIGPNDYLTSDECCEMRECRDRHRQWIASRGVVMEPPYLPLSPSTDTSKWEFPPLAGQPQSRRRLVVPIAPHGIGLPRFVNCDDAQKGVAGIADAFSSDVAHEHTTENEEGGDEGVPVQQPGTPRVMDAQRMNYRWDPYRMKK